MGRNFYLPCHTSEMSAGTKLKSFQKVTDKKQIKKIPLNNNNKKK